MHLINKYVLIFDELAQLMLQNYQICIILEDYLDPRDLIEGVF